MAIHELQPVPEMVHWGYFDAVLPPRMTVASGDMVTIGTFSGGREDVDLDTVQPGHRRIIETLSPQGGPHILTGPIAAMVPRELVPARIA